MAWNGIAILHTGDIKVLYEYLLVEGENKTLDLDIFYISSLGNISGSAEYSAVLFKPSLCFRTIAFANAVFSVLGLNSSLSCFLY